MPKSRRQKRNDRAHNAKVARAVRREDARGRQPRRNNVGKAPASHFQKQMSKECREFCLSIGDPEHCDLSNAVVDATHLGDVENAIVVHSVSKGTVTSVNLGVSAYCSIVASGHDAMANDTPAVVATAAGNVAPDVLPTFGGVLAGLYVPSSPNVPWTRTQLTSSGVRVAYVASELRVFNTTSFRFREGTSYGSPLPESNLDAFDGVNTNVAIAYPTCHTSDGMDQFSITHVAGTVVDAFAEGKVETITNNPSFPTQVWSWQGTIANGQTFYYEFHTIFYAWGPRVMGGSPIMRMPRLWACVRDAYSSGQTEPVLTKRDNVRGDRRREAKVFAKVAESSMMDTAVSALLEYGPTLAKAAASFLV